MAVWLIVSIPVQFPVLGASVARVTATKKNYVRGADADW